ncbi:hypothetical protein [Massilia psychrophila]|uniref:Uncharacterized protein n=1 Tax=Massilia psychrophila TaxID=1603353 RepID=A0A2G8SZI3_9BURK|nr:hypothetical protein [Massilia psychrophila]PIL39181.1 hypothetical protein CR103_13910 [Massilia psychrophila]GGE82317.1 hypothetical protein GCM10008020_29030 [Massilia psychrophila]
MTIPEGASVQALEREVAQIYSVLDYAIHELPAGVLWAPNAANDAQCAELLVDLNRFEELSKQLAIPAQDFIDACRWHLDHYPHYRSRQRHFVDYASYCIDRGGPLRVPLLTDVVRFQR